MEYELNLCVCARACVCVCVRSLPWTQFLKMFTLFWRLAFPSGLASPRVPSVVDRPFKCCTIMLDFSRGF